MDKEKLLFIAGVILGREMQVTFEKDKSELEKKYNTLLDWECEQISEKYNEIKKSMNTKTYNQIVDEAFIDYCTTKEKWVKNEDGTTSLLRYSSAGHYGFVTKEEFIQKCKTDPEFAKKWGIKIEERDLSYTERWFLAYNETFENWRDRLAKTNEYQIPGCDLADRWTNNGIPTKLITITYKDEKIETYE